MGYSLSVVIKRFIDQEAEIIWFFITLRDFKQYKIELYDKNKI